MKYLFLILFALNVQADCVNEEWTKQKEISGEVTLEQFESIEEFCKYEKDLEKELCEIETCDI